MNMYEKEKKLPFSSIGMCVGGGGAVGKGGGEQEGQLIKQKNKKRAFCWINSSFFKVSEEIIICLAKQTVSN